MSIVVHKKIEEKWLEDIRIGYKRFEIRKHDPNVTIGTVIHLYCPEMPTYDAYIIITYILTNNEFPEGLQKDYEIWGFDLLEQNMESFRKYHNIYKKELNEGNIVMEY